MTAQIFIHALVEDTRLTGKNLKIAELGAKNPPQIVALVEAYTVKKALKAAQLKEIADSLHNPVSQKAEINALTAPKDFTWAIEIGYLPGVTDNIANTVKTAAEELLKVKFALDEGVWSSQIYFVRGKLTEKDAKEIGKIFANPLIQRIHVKSAEQFRKDKGMDVVVPEVKLHSSGKVLEVNLDISDDELVKIGKEGVANPDGSRRGSLALDLSYMKTIQAYFKKLGRKPTDIEIESIAQTWSEHCKHTIFADPIDDVKKGLFKTFIKRATEEVRRKKGKKDFCVSVFTDNSGAIAFDEKYLVTDKVETHNSPSALDPFGGSITGIVGVNRDALGFGLGAKPILNRYGFCFAPADDETQLFRDQEKTQPLLSARRIMEGVVAGVNSGGNCSGIPTPQGFMYFDHRYRGKPLVFVGTLGLIPRKNKNKKLYDKKAEPGDYIVVIGGRVGLDGIHGATFSSETLTSKSPVTAVQIGDPITQKKLSDAIVKEARDMDLYTSITDNGAGGLSCSVAEMAKESGGFKVQLEKVPLKYAGLEPWQTWISESQERMTLSVPPKKWPAFAKLMERHGVEATVIGTFTKATKCEVTYNGKKILDMDMEFLHDGLPPRVMKSARSMTKLKNPTLNALPSLDKVALKMLARPSIASTAMISQQYDHEVQGTSVLKPLQGKGRVSAETTVIQPLPNSQKGVAVSQALYPSYSEIDAYEMTAASIDTAIRNLVAAGVHPDAIALLDNFCWCSSTEPERLGQLKEAAQACYDLAVAYQAPFISGKDSMFNDFKGFDAQGKPIKISVPPTLLISSLAVIEDVKKVVSLDAKMVGDIVYVLGQTHEELGGSELYRWLAEEKGSETLGTSVPHVDAKKNLELYRVYAKAIEAGLVASAIPVTRGGLWTALSKMALGGMLGIDANLSKLPGSAKTDVGILFSESQGRIVLTVAPENQKRFEKLFKKGQFAKVGQITADPVLKLKLKKKSLDVPLRDAYAAYFSTSPTTHPVIPHLGTLTNGFAKKGAKVTKPKVLIVTGYGINCEEETATAFELAGAETQIVHINELIKTPSLLHKSQILAVPGGFSYGDDTGSGNAYAQKLRNNLWPELKKFAKGDHLIIGICNGCQILVNLGLLPAIDEQYGQRDVALLHNDSALYTDRWVDLSIEGKGPWLEGISSLTVPIAHGEGKFFASPEVLAHLEKTGQVAARYFQGEMCQTFQLPANPNGSAHNIAALTDPTGRVLGLMPHPERSVRFTQLPHWTLLKEQYQRQGKAIPEQGPGLQIFVNAVRYFTEKELHARA